MAAGAMKAKSFRWILLIPLLPLAGRGAVYVEPRVSVLYAPDAEVGDLGQTTDHDYTSLAPGIALGHAFNDRIALEIRYARVTDFTQHKLAPDFRIFPGMPVTPQVTRPYSLTLESDLFSLALPITVWTGERWSVALTPLVMHESTHVVVRDGILPNTLTVPNPPPIVDRTDRGLRPAAEFGLSLRLSPRAAARFHYTYGALAHYDAHLFGAGLGWTF